MLAATRTPVTNVLEALMRELQVSERSLECRLLTYNHMHGGRFLKNEIQG